MVKIGLQPYIHLPTWTVHVNKKKKKKQEKQKNKKTKNKKKKRKRKIERKESQFITGISIIDNIGLCIS